MMSRSQIRTVMRYPIMRDAQRRDRIVKLLSWNLEPVIRNGRLVFVANHEVVICNRSFVWTSARVIVQLVI